MSEDIPKKLLLPPRVSHDGLFLLGLQQLLSKAVIPAVPTQPAPADCRCEVSQDVTSSNSRKRKKGANNGLSEAEKRQKRMVMNRVAAQNAREKKRQYVEELEKKLSQLEAQNKLLAEENRLLKAEASRLVLVKGQVETGTDMSSMSAVENSISRRSAAPQVSRQKKQALRALLLQTWMAISLLACPLENSGLKQHFLQATLPQMAPGSPTNCHLILTLMASLKGTSSPRWKEPP